MAKAIGMSMEEFLILFEFYILNLISNGGLKYKF